MDRDADIIVRRDAPKGNSFAWLWIFVALFVIGVVIFLIFLFTQNDKGDNSDDNDERVSFVNGDNNRINGTNGRVRQVTTNNQVQARALGRRSDQPPVTGEGGINEPVACNGQTTIPVQRNQVFSIRPVARSQQALTLTTTRPDPTIIETNRSYTQRFQLMPIPNGNNQFVLYVGIPSNGQNFADYLVLSRRNGQLTTDLVPEFSMLERRPEAVWVWHPNCQMLTDPNNQYKLSVDSVARQVGQTTQYNLRPRLNPVNGDLRSKIFDRWNFAPYSF